MQVATYFIRHGDAVAQDELNAFLRGHRILRVEKAFADGGWSFCVEWLEASGEAREWRTKKIDYKAVLDEAAFARFALLRERRKAIAQKDGVPPYMVMTDAQMAEAAKEDALTEDKLKAIAGFGDARFEKYGERLLMKGQT